MHGAHIAVTITPRGITRPMASAAVAVVLALSHRLVQRHEVVRSGRWSEGRFDLIGTVDRTDARRRRIREDRAGGRAPAATVADACPRRHTPGPGDETVQHVGLDVLIREADVDVLACPLTPETRHLLGAERLALMKPTAVLVNVARGPIVDEAALADALHGGRLAGAGLDVFEQEPVDRDDPILDAPNVVAAPHALGYVDELSGSASPIPAGPAPRRRRAHPAGRRQPRGARLGAVP